MANPPWRPYKRPMDAFLDQLRRLAAVIDARRGADPASSYTAQLLAAGPARAAKKLGEEAVELAIAAAERDGEAVASESADLLYHWLVLLAACDVPPDAVAAALARRIGQSGLQEKVSRV